MHEALLKSILDNTLPNNTDSQFVYNKLQKNPHLRKSLASLNTAKSLYTDPGLLGLKIGIKKHSMFPEAYSQMLIVETSVLDWKAISIFLVQLDIQNLKSPLMEKDSEQKDMSFHPTPKQHCCPTDLF